MIFMVIIAGIGCGKDRQEIKIILNTNFNYIIVLGAQVKENGPSAVLKYRLDVAIEYLNENPDTVCIVSGGQGYNEPFSEAKGMADYLKNQGIDVERIIQEDKSTTTVENIKFSMALMEQKNASVGVVANDFHVYRATQIAKKQGLHDVSGIAAYSSIPYLPNNILRECCGILVDIVF